MREIKFRAWDKKLKQWVVEGFHVFGEVTLFNLIGQHCYETKGEGDSLERYNDMEVTQFTGLNDRNGKEIYEGDRVKVIHLSSDGVTTLIEEITTVEWVGCGFQPLIRHSNEYMEVIGNIYESTPLQVE